MYKFSRNSRKMSRYDQVIKICRRFFFSLFLVHMNLRIVREREREEGRVLILTLGVMLVMALS